MIYNKTFYYNPANTGAHFLGVESGVTGFFKNNVVCSTDPALITSSALVYFWSTMKRRCGGPRNGAAAPRCVRERGRRTAVSPGCHGRIWTTTTEQAGTV
jgi:energy-converting hydrogenase Eha subunit B